MASTFNIVLQTLFALRHMFVLAYSQHTRYKREKTCCSRIMLVHVLLQVGNIMFVIAILINIAPMLYFMMWIGNISQVLSFSLLTESVLTSNDTFIIQ